MTASNQSSGTPPATLCLALSGRFWAWPMTAAFLEQQTWPHDRIALRLLDTSGNPEFHDLVRAWTARCGYTDVTLTARAFGEPGLADRDRPAHADEVRAACAGIYAWFAEIVETPWVFVLEDDVQPPVDVYPRLHRHLGGEVVSACGYYLGRLAGDPIAWDWSDAGRPEPSTPGTGVSRVGGHGFGAAVFDGSIFKPARFHAGPPLHDFDYNFFHQLTVVENRQAVVDWDCLYRHYSGAGQWVQNPDVALRLRLLPGAKAPLSIIHLNAYDHHGGAERLAGDLIAAQRGSGHRSMGLVGHKTRPDSPAIAFDPDPDLTARPALQAGGWPDYEFRGSHRLADHESITQADVIHAHNLYGGYFHPFSLIALSWHRPVIWSIHDMQALTGYCSHALDCPRWQTGCGNCPDLTRPGPSLPFDNTTALWRDKKLISDNSRLWIATGSTWMVGQLRKSLLGRHPIHLIPNGIDTRLFHPTDKPAMRRKLGLPEDALIVGSLARSGVLAHPWKGGSHAMAVLETLRAAHPDLRFLNLGASSPGPHPWMVPIASDDPGEIRDALGALDLFLHPSIADTAPLAVLEALACGLPVLGFQTGGIPDMVTTAEGILVPHGDTGSLTEAALVLAADAARREQMGRAARDRAVRLFDVSVMAAGYERLYHEAIVSHAGNHLPRYTTTTAGTDARHLEELRLLQGERLQLKSKLRDRRAKQEAEQKQLATLLDHQWIKFGRKLGVFKGPLRKWLDRKTPPP